MIKITLVDYGIANVIDGEIIINRALLKHPKLYDRIIAHEMKHIHGERWVDWNDPFDPELFRWVIKTPSSWIQFSPVWIRNRTIIYSRVMLLLWAFFILVSVLTLLAVKNM
tara:strand:- start:24 stop:356 length:333 start_codon:yes stop_codon:yes gene_type:complete